MQPLCRTVFRPMCSPERILRSHPRADATPAKNLVNPQTDDPVKEGQWLGADWRAGEARARATRPPYLASGVQRGWYIQKCKVRPRSRERTCAHAGIMRAGTRRESKTQHLFPGVRIPTGTMHRTRPSESRTPLVANMRHPARTHPVVT